MMRHFVRTSIFHAFQRLVDKACGFRQARREPELFPRHSRQFFDSFLIVATSLPAPLATAQNQAFSLRPRPGAGRNRRRSAQAIRIFRRRRLAEGFAYVKVYLRLDGEAKTLGA
jgi:hypothetical protein